MPVKYFQHKNNRINEMGNPNLNQVAKVISYPNVSSTTPANIKFGGVPINVLIPPIDALYAIPNIKALPKILFSFSIVFGLSFSWSTIAIAIGNIITAVAVLEIHIERKAVATIKPSMIFITSVPIKLIIFNAILLCKFHICIAIAIIKPPRYKKTYL